MQYLPQFRRKIIFKNLNKKKKYKNSSGQSNDNRMAKDVSKWLKFNYAYIQHTNAMLVGPEIVPNIYSFRIHHFNFVGIETLFDNNS